MKRIRISAVIFGLATLFVFPFTVHAQESRPVGERQEASTRRTQPAEPESPATRGVTAQGNQAAAPRLVKVSGELTGFARNSMSSSVEMTFAVYKDEVGGEALWTETQSVEVDKEGRYTVLLGAAQADGVPVELFPAGEPRWLGVEIRGQVPQARTLLVSVPYALKALDAEKLSGKSLSDFVLSESLGEQVRQVIQAQGQSAGQSALAGAQQKQTGTSSTTTPQTTPAGPMFPPSTFIGTNSTQIVQVTQNGTGNGLVSQTASSTGNSGVVGIASSSSTSNNQNGVIGFNAGAGSGVAGIATNPAAGVGVYGQSANFAGVFGNSFVTSGFATGVFGIGTSPDGAGVFGGNNATSGFAPGVSANSASPNGVGVFGNALATSGFATGVQGLTHSPSGEGVGGFGITTGVFGTANATSGFSSGVFGQSFSPDGAGVNGFANATSGFAIGVSGGTASSDGAGVFGNAIATSGFASGVTGQTASPGGSGVVGFADATSGFTNGVFGQSVSPNGNGVLGVNNATNDGDGVTGIANGTTGNSNGVFGVTHSTGFGAGVSARAIATTGPAFAVFGESNSPSGTAMFGHAVAGSGFPSAVVGFLDGSSGGVAGTFVAHTGAGLILQGLSGPNFNQVFSVDANGNLNVSGNLVVSGTKSSTAKLQSGREVALYAVESPENWFEDFGSAELKSGAAWVPLDASFAEATNAAVTYHVFLTPNGDSNGLYVARKTATGFEVREHGGGDSNVAFDYRIVVRRRGYEAVRMAEVQRDVKTADASRQHLAQFVTSGIPIKAATIKPPRNIQAPAMRPMPARPNAPEVPRPIVPQAPKVSVPQAPKGSAPQPSQPR